MEVLAKGQWHFDKALIILVKPVDVGEVITQILLTCHFRLKSSIYPLCTWI